MVKKKILKTIVSTKFKINNYLNNEKVIAINDLFFGHISFFIL